MDAPTNKNPLPESPTPVLKDEEGFTELHMVSKRGNIDKLKKLISEGCDLDAVIPIGRRKGRTALHIAIKFERTQITKILLENGADFTLKDDNNENLLRIAMKKYCAESVRLILQAYYTACSKIDENIKELLVEKDLPIDNNMKVDDKFLEKFRPLHFAVDCELIDMMPILIGNGIDIQGKDSNGMSALHCAVQYTQIRCRGNDDRDASPPRLIKIIDFLLKYGSDINALDDFGKTPIFYLYKTITVPNVDVASISQFRAEDMNLRKDLFRRFKPLSPDLTIQDSEGNTILHLMAKAGYGATDFEFEGSILEEYVNSGGDFNAIDASGHTPLYYACGNGHVNLIKALLDLGADVNLTRSKDRKRPIHRAIEFLVQRTKLHPNLNYDLMGELFQHGAYVDAAMSDGSMPVQLATDLNDYPCRESLLTCLLDWDCGEDNHMMQVFMMMDDSKFGKSLVQRLSNAETYGKLVSLHAGILFTPDMHKFVSDEFGPRVADSCTSELDVMKTVQIDERTTLFDIVKMNPRELVGYLNNKQLIDVFINPSFRNTYSIYGCLLNKRLRHAVKRDVLCKAAMDTLLLIFKLDLPHVFETIISHLENNDLINLLEANVTKNTTFKYKNKEKLSSADQERLRLQIAINSPYLL